MSLGIHDQGRWSRQCAAVQGQASMWRKSANQGSRLPCYESTNCLLGWPFAGTRDHHPVRSRDPSNGPMHRFSWESTWRKGSIYTHRRVSFVCSRMGAGSTIQDRQRLRSWWYFAWESLFIPQSSPSMFGMLLLRTSWSRLDLWHHILMEDTPCLRMKAQSLPQSFCTSMISLSLLTSALLSRSKIRWKRGSGSMISGVSPYISAWTWNAIWSITRSTPIMTATFGQSSRSSECTSPGELARQWQRCFTGGSPTIQPEIRPSTNRWLEALPMRWPPRGRISHLPSELSAGIITTRDMSIRYFSSSWFGTSMARRIADWISEERSE